ncbi:MAG TPA: HutD family protein, partial [Marmoricola sp.]|nr:HutD family protein [Marmoricola sp.]
MADEMMIVRATDATVVPWRNGGGSTREYFKVGGDDFDWRLSVAQIVQPGPFSAFPGILSLDPGPASPY